MANHNHNPHHVYLLRCVVCNKAYNYPKRLQNHMRNDHPEYDPLLAVNNRNLNNEHRPGNPPPIPRQSAPARAGPAPHNSNQKRKPRSGRRKERKAKKRYAVIGRGTSTGNNSGSDSIVEVVDLRSPSPDVGTNGHGGGGRGSRNPGPSWKVADKSETPAERPRNANGSVHPPRTSTSKNAPAGPVQAKARTHTPTPRRPHNPGTAPTHQSAPSTPVHTHMRLFSPGRDESESDEDGDEDIKITHIKTEPRGAQSEESDADAEDEQEQEHEDENEAMALKSKYRASVRDEEEEATLYHSFSDEMGDDAPSPTKTAKHPPSDPDLDMDSEAAAESEATHYISDDTPPPTLDKGKGVKRGPPSEASAADSDSDSSETRPTKRPTGDYWGTSNLNNTNPGTSSAAKMLEKKSPRWSTAADRPDKAPSSPTTTRTVKSSSAKYPILQPLASSRTPTQIVNQTPTQSQTHPPTAPSTPLLVPKTHQPNPFSTKQQPQTPVSTKTATQDSAPSSIKPQAQSPLSGKTAPLGTPSPTKPTPSRDTQAFLLQAGAASRANGSASVPASPCVDTTAPKTAAPTGLGGSGSNGSVTPARTSTAGGSSAASTLPVAPPRTTLHAPGERRCAVGNCRLCHTVSHIIHWVHTLPLFRCEEE